MKNTNQTDKQTINQTLNKLHLFREKLAESQEIVAFATLCIVFIFFTFAAPNFLSLYALSNILTFASVLGVTVIGMAFLMISGEFDLSIGSNLAVAAYVFLLSLLAGVPSILAMLLALAVSAFLGFINGLIVVYSGIPSFIATLGTLLAYRGLARALGGARSITYAPESKPALFAVLNGFIVPLNELFKPAANFRTSSIWFLVLIVVMSIILMKTRYGNWSFSVGGNPSAALLLGVNVKMVKLINFTLSGFFAGIAGVLLLSQRSAMNELIGEGMELTAVAAAVIGGVSLAGGSGTIVGAALGMLLLSMLEQGLVLMGVTNELFQGVVGGIIIISVIVNIYLKKQKE